MISLAAGTTGTILATVAAFLLITLLLVALLLFVKQKLSPSGPVMITINGENISVWRVKEVENNQENIEPGKVLSINNQSVVVKCFDNAIEIIEHEIKILPKIGQHI